ncbi:MAG: FecR family protein [Kofleriaceae bacterium]
MRDRIKVETLDEERVTNIERRLVVAVSNLSMQPAPKRTSWGLAFAGAALAAVIGVVGWKLVTREQEYVVMPPQLIAVKAPPTPVTVELDHSRAIAANATISGTSSLVITEAAQTVIAMQAGSLDFDVVHDPSRTLIIRAGDTEIQDIGTKFHVDYDGSRVAVRVTEGEVQVTRAAKSERVLAGHAWASDGVPDHVIAAAEPHVTAPVVVQPKRVEHHVEVTLPVVTDHPQPQVTQTDPFVELRTAIRKVPLAFASSIDGHNDAAGEIARLKKVAYSPTTLGPEAARAMYQIALLLYRPLGQDAEAMRTLDVFMRRFHAGAERDAAMWLRVRIACEKSLDETCRRAAYSYQHEVSSGEGADVAVRITNAP